MATGTAIIDFGSTPTDHATILVSGMSGLTVDSYIEAYMQGSDSTGDNTVDAHQQLAVRTQFYCEYVSSSSMNIVADVFIGFATGTFKLRYATA